MKDKDKDKDKGRWKGKDERVGKGDVLGHDGQIAL